MQVNHLILQFSEALNVLFCNFFEALNVLFCNFMHSILHKIRTFHFLNCTKSALFIF